MASDPLFNRIAQEHQNPSVGNVGTTKKAPTGNRGKLAAATAASNVAPIAVPKPAEQGTGFFDTPVIKQIFDALGIGTYTAGNISSDTMDRMKRFKEGTQTTADIINIINPGITGLNALSEGARGAFLGQDEYKKTQAGAIAKGQELLGIDPTSQESKNVQGALGFVGDIALDPTTYIGLGVATNATRGAFVGAKKFKEAAAFASKTGTPLSETVAPTMWKNMKAAASNEVAAYRKMKLDVAQANQAGKALKKSKGADADTIKADFLVENVQTLRPAVKKAIVKSMDDPHSLIEKVMAKGSAETAAKMTADLTDTAAHIVDDAPISAAENIKPRLSTFKPPTMEEQLFNELGKLRTTSLKPIYPKEVADNVAQLIAAKGDKIKNSDLTTLGIAYDHIDAIKKGTPVGDIVTTTSKGDIDSIAREIRDGKVPEVTVKALYDITGQTTRKDLYDFIKNTTSSDNPKWAETRANLGSYGTFRTGNPLPNLGVSGHGQLSMSGRGFTNWDNLAAKSPANPEQSKAFLEEMYMYHANNLAMHPRAAELRIAADDIFHDALNNLDPVARAENAALTVSDMKFRSVGAFDGAWLKILSDVDHRLNLAGVPNTLSRMAKSEDKLVARLSPSDVFGMMKQSDRIKFLHGGLKGSEVHSYQSVLDMAETLLRSATKRLPDGRIDFEDLKNTAMATLLGRTEKGVINAGTVNKANEEILKALDTKLGTEYFKQYAKEASQTAKDALMEVVKKSAPKEFGAIASSRLKGSAELFHLFTKDFETKPSILGELINTNMRNAAIFGGHVARPIGEAAAAMATRVSNALDNGTAGEFLSELVSRPPFRSADPAARQIINEYRTMIQRSMGTHGEVQAAEALQRNVDGIGTAAANNARAFQRSDTLTSEMARNPRDINTELAYDLSVREANKDILFRAWGFSKWFNKRAGMRISYEDVVGSAHAASLVQTAFHGVINGWRAEGITSEQLRVAFQNIKNGVADDKVATKLRGAMDMLFDPSRNNFLSRNSVGPKHFNEVMEAVGMNPKLFKVPLDATPEQMIDVWKTWDVHNVEDFLSRMMRAISRTSEEVSTGAAISTKFGKAAPEAGYVKLADPSKLNPLFPLIDQTLYYPKEVAEEFVFIGRMMKESRAFQPGDKFYTFVNKIMDPVISSLKLTQTTLKPGHHIMSITGDLWRNSMALDTLGFISPAKQLTVHKESLQVLMQNVGRINEFGDLQQFRRIQNLTNEIKLHRDGGGALYFANIGAGGKISLNKIYEIWQAKGVSIPSHLAGMSEDLLHDFNEVDSLGKATGNLIVKGVSKVTGGLDRLVNPLNHKYSLNAFTANRDTFTRGALFLGAMRSRKFKTVEEAADYAANVVKKWAPMATDFTAFEAKYARRMIFYYTWIRGMVPRMIESALIKPGVAIAPYKLAYNAAYSQGIDPTSIGNPFPPGQMLPSWFSERVIGPQWKANGDLWGANPTGPLGDVLDSLGANVKPKDFLTPDAYTKTAGNILNMSNPFFRVPWELTTGKTIQGNFPIQDPAQYIQDIVGPTRTASRIIGRDLYPVIDPNGGITLPTRTEAKYRRGMTPEETTQNAIPELVNWATGLQFTNYTSNAATSAAYKQKKDEIAAQRLSNQRTGG